jgi:carnitine O-acetyltransferase
MNQYKKQYGTTRIPGSLADKIVSAHPCTSDFIILMVRDKLFKVTVQDSEGHRASVKELKR